VAVVVQTGVAQVALAQVRRRLRPSSLARLAPTLIVSALAPVVLQTAKAGL
jgi:hypothetical protein